MLAAVYLKRWPAHAFFFKAITLLIYHNLPLITPHITNKLICSQF